MQMPGSVMITCNLKVSRSLSSAKIMPASGKRAFSYFPECSLSSAKIMPASGKRAFSYFPECSLSSAKISQGVGTAKRINVKRDSAVPDVCR